MYKLDRAQQSPKSIKAAESLLLFFRNLLMEWSHFYHQVTWITGQSLFYMGFSLSRKNNFIVETVVFFFLAEKRHNPFINIIINSCDAIWTFLREIPQMEKGNTWFSGTGEPENNSSHVRISRPLSIGHSNMVFCVMTEILKCHCIFSLITSWIFLCLN